MPARRKNLAVRPISSANLFALAILNLRRHGLRAAVNIAGISIAVAALVFFLSFYRGTYEGVMFSSVIDYATPQGQFMSSSFEDDDPDLWLEPENLFDEKLAQDGILQRPTSGSGRRSPILPHGFSARPLPATGRARRR